MQVSSELAEEFRHYRTIVKGGSALTAEAYLRSATMYFTWLGDQDMTSRSVERWLIDLYAAGHLANSSRANRLAGLRAVCGWMVERGEMDDDPTVGVPSPKFSHHSAQKFSKNDMHLLLTAGDLQTVQGLRDRAIILLFYITGMRRSEMARLQLEHLTLGQTTGRVSICGKGLVNRGVSFEGARVVSVIRAWLVARAGVADVTCSYVFCSIITGNKLGFGGLRGVLLRSAMLAGLGDEGVFLHKLRATFATDLYDQGMDIKTIQLLMGHARVDTTMCYIAISEKHLKSARLSAVYTHGLL
ncbi:MAG: tyrosine-type recombinase/integrase [Mariprofundaceae bacterium]|nr:tyrosine-type recombinase/integrase [Mariprofundaceae bacterium]